MIKSCSSRDDTISKIRKIKKGGKHFDDDSESTHENAFQKTEDRLL